MNARNLRVTKLSIDSDLIELALEVSGERSNEAVVTKALRKFITQRGQKRLGPYGKLKWDASYEYKQERRRERVTVSALS